VSDTPRTDRARLDEHDPAVAVASECSKLERELNAANEMFRKLNIHALNLTDRIRRLEEAGDLMVQHFYTDEPRSEMWEKAKEAKP
jgi:DNA-binding HxlR family transcriptional regulator